MHKLQLKPFHPTLIVDLNKDDFDRHNEICLEKFNYDPAFVDGTTSVYLAENKQLIATMVYLLVY